VYITTLDYYELQANVIGLHQNMDENLKKSATVSSKNETSYRDLSDYSVMSCRSTFPDYYQTSTKSKFTYNN